MAKRLICFFLFILFILSGCTLKKEDTTFRIKFVTNYEKCVADLIFEKNSNITAESLPNLVRDNYYFDGWYIDKDFIIPFSEVYIINDITLYAKWTEFSEVMENKVLDTIKLDSETYQNLVLPTYKNGYNIIWSSSNVDVIDNSGKYSIVLENTEVILTAKIITNTIEFTKEFTVIAKPYPYDEFFAIAFASINFADQIKENIELPIVFNNGITGVWVSNKPEVISNDGKVTLTNNEETVSLTLTLSLHNEKRKLSYEVNTVAKNYDELFAEALSTINIPNQVSANLILPINFSNNITGTWVSSKPDVISNSGNVKLTSQVETVSLTLTLSLDSVEKIITYEVKTTIKGLSVQDAGYFINRLKSQDIDVNKVLMNEDEIASYNQTVLNSTGTKVVALDKISTTIKKEALLSLINFYSNIDKYTIYNNKTNKAITSSEKAGIYNNRNVENIASENDIRYAVSVTHTSLRAYPTMYYSQTDSIDRFQETGFSLGIPMVIYHQSLDNNWYFVQMYNYYGWVQASDIGLCDRDTFLKYYRPEKFIVNLTNVLNIDGESLRMGYKLPYATKDSTKYQVEMPKRNSSGSLEIKLVDLSLDSDVSDGFIPYTYENLLIQAFKMLNIHYSWGDKIVNAFDCSSTQASIYGCFGFVNGRNTSNQWKTNIYGKTINSLSNEYLKTYQVGTLLYTSGHVLMYIGTDVNDDCWLLHNTSSGNICKVQSLNSFGTGGIKYVLEVRKMN